MVLRHGNLCIHSSPNQKHRNMLWLTPEDLSMC